MTDSAIITDRKEHAKLLAYLIISIQNRILSINNTDTANLGLISSQNLEEITNIGILKLRELCTFLVEIKVVNEEDLPMLMKGFLIYQTELAVLIKREVIKIYEDAANEESIEDPLNKILESIKSASDPTIH